MPKATQKSTSLPSQSQTDFTVRNEGSIVLLTPHSDAAREWVSEHIGRDNGFQPYWPTVVIERRYIFPIVEGNQCRWPGSALMRTRFSWVEYWRAWAIALALLVVLPMWAALLLWRGLKSICKRSTK